VGRRTDQLPLQLVPGGLPGSSCSCRRTRAPSTPPVDSFDERGGSCDGSPQPLAEESIAKTSARLELIIAL